MICLLIISTGTAFNRAYAVHRTHSELYCCHISINYSPLSLTISSLYLPTNCNSSIHHKNLHFCYHFNAVRFIYVNTVKHLFILNVVHLLSILTATADILVLALISLPTPLGAMLIYFALPSISFPFFIISGRIAMSFKFL